MLEHQKLVLRNVAYNKELFRKELHKSLVWLNSYDISQLFVWLKENFWDLHKDVIEEVVYPVKALA
jgi:hypothetical protein